MRGSVGAAGWAGEGMSTGPLDVSKRIVEDEPSISTSLMDEAIKDGSERTHQLLKLAHHNADALLHYHRNTPESINSSQNRPIHRVFCQVNHHFCLV